MSDREALIPITAEQATLIVPLLRQEAAERRENGDGLILRTGMKQAGFNWLFGFQRGVIVASRPQFGLPA